MRADHATAAPDNAGAVEERIALNVVDVVFLEHGAHIEELGTFPTVYRLRKR